MADQIGTPGSNADTSINGGSKVGSAPKDKACPFCHQPFTSSSLGRHLDLYIKEKNPKPPDGLHHVDEIRKLRGGITRRQPRNSIRRREDSTPAGTPGAHERRSPREEGAREDRSPSVRREDIGTSNLLYNGKPRILMHVPGWEATGVMNNIPPANSADVRSIDGGEERDIRRGERGPRSVSKQMIAKSTFDQKQKMMEALDSAKAAELALRELLGSLRAANHRTLSGAGIFDYDPLILDFPALCLHCLPPPPTLHSSTPVSHPDCWTITPPGDAQYEAIRAHFSTAFRNFRNTLAITSTEPIDDLSYPPPPENYLSPQEDMAAQALRVEVEASELESKINSHIHDVFAGWNSFSSTKRAETWTLELARSVGRKSLEIQKLKEEKHVEQQTSAHLKLEIDQLNRLQQPREFRIVPPKTIPIGQDTINMLGEMATEMEMRQRSVGFTVLDRSENLDVVVERAVGRWKGVVKQARGDGGGGGGGGGLANQRSLSDGSMLLSPAGQNLNRPPNPVPIPNHPRNPPPNQNSAAMNHNHSTSMPMSNGLESIGSDADADADMEEEDSYVELNDLSDITNQGYRLTNGTGKPGGMEGIINESGGGGGFGRINA